ncbi:P-loop NTPase fold protein [Acinetobacter chinensis]|uniref:P-loop NTPase fold protein n=1 Tax=Acinetobacter chinensis TaxID=2004650 RepID=UPI0029342F46|nr:P-loop NTPase fold protein [Acinetobacter chinensis]WOE41428.1 P-loop NTPase fold protein [Acinetobacter chinensis]
MNQIERLEEIFRKNDNKGIAIAITGSWGVGKTFFWHEFIKEKIKQEKQERDKYYYKATLVDKQTIFDKKYSYVSLFGIETLSDLKTQIYTQLSGHHFSVKEQPKFEVPRWVKAIASGLKDEKISQLGFSASMRFFDSMLFAQVKDAIICFDDFERMSNKLDIKDVMGLANQLKLEKKCQIILILDEDKAEGENKKKYAEYKEKLIDETIKITSVEPLIRENAKDIDEPLVGLMVKFADELDIHNFRFFQKVIKLYKQFLEQLPETVADSTKEIILVRILQGYFIEEFGISYEFDWEDIKITIKDKQKDWSEKKVKTYDSLFSINSYFLRSDEWLNEFKKWFNQVGMLDFELLNQLANSTLISEENNKHKDNFHQSFEDFWGLKVDKKFPNNFYEKTRLVIGLENLSNLSFALKILEIFNIDVTTLEQEIIDWLKGKIEKDMSGFRLYDSFVEMRPIFKNFVETYELDKENLPNLIDAIFNIHIRQGWRNEDELSVQKASKEDWEKMLFDEISQDSRFDSVNSSYIVKKVLEREKYSDLGEHIRNVIIEIYNEKGQTDEFYKSYMDFLITRLDN